MPKNKFQDVVFTIIMAAIMVRKDQSEKIKVRFRFFTKIE